MMNASSLAQSLEQLSAITEQSYNDQIRPVASNLWVKLLSPKNPVWKFISAEPFHLNRQDGSAHVIAFVDERLPDIGFVGFFACTNSSVGAEVLQQAASWLKKEYGIKDAYGPVNGTLPTDYRLNLSDDYQVPGEPVNPPWHIEAFREAGFKVFNNYVSGLSKHYQLFMKLFIRKPSKKYDHIRVRAFDIKHQGRDFEIYHNLRNAIFPFQSIYCPAISLEERFYSHGNKNPLFNPKYTYFLEDKGQAIGFIMSYPYNHRLIIKTVGMLPEYRGKRLASLLIRRVHDQAKQDGLKEAVYAMIRVGNRIYQMKRPGVKVYRKYVTMQKSV